MNINRIIITKWVDFLIRIVLSHYFQPQTQVWITKVILCLCLSLSLFLLAPLIQELFFITISALKNARIMSPIGSNKISVISRTQ